jgi:VWFA-related protein
VEPSLISRRVALFSAASLVHVCRMLRAQDTPRAPAFSSNVRVVNVLATVRDKQGQIVRNLARDDFAIEEDGRPQIIRYFSRQSDLPLTLGLLVDTSGSERRMLGAERQASYTFLEQVLRPEEDKAFLVHFDHEVELLQDLTSSRERLEKALDQLDKPDWGQSGGGQQPGGRGGGGYGRHGGQGGSGRYRGGTAFYDAIYLASDDLMKKQTGRKALIMLTDGEDNASKISQAEAITTAQRSDALGYSIRIADDEEPHSGFGGPGMGRRGGWGGGHGGPGGGGPHGPASNHVDGKKVLQEISKQTGGAYFEVSKKRSVDQIFSELQQELRNQYSLGYTSDKPGTETGYRKIRVTTKQKGLTIQARDGYYVGA